MGSAGSYDPHAVESAIYDFWERGGYFHAEPRSDRRPYVIDIPLPNVTGALHLGHALNNTLQDILIRHKRMRGYEAMWMPGTDHAGIATQAVVERKLREEQNLTRHQLGRDGLVAKIWEWKEKYGEQILTQLRKIGCSLDWPRTRFTLDEVCARAVYEVFFRWFKEGLIYRGTRLVNWDAYLQTAVADDEIVHETVRGHLWHYRYPILKSDEATEPRSRGGDMASGHRHGHRVPDDLARAALARATRPDAKPGEDYLSIATTRPETMLGDTALAVHPDDPRYKHLIGRHVLLPLQNRAIPVIGDPILVKIEFGTGCVKVTPGHDPNDYECGHRHKLEFINILTRDGKINDNGGAYAGMDRYDARKKVVEDLERLGLLEKIEPYEMQVGHSDRSKTPIEPMLSEQWFVKMAELCELAMEAVRDGRVQFFPERYAKTYLDWLDEKRDWCISRQLWWGHRIPVWRWRTDFQFVPGGINEVADAVRNGLVVVKYDPEHRDSFEYWQVLMGFKPGDLRAVQRPIKLHFCPRPEFMEQFARLADDAGLVQDEDVLDTWFSSALWPFSTLGWPHEQSRDRKGAANDAESTRAAGDQPLADARGSDQTAPSHADFEYFYPTSALVTGRGIITLWVARMVMTGLYFTGRVPFQHVHIHPIILDGQGRIMSKSLGNGVDPLDIIELYGTDALRFVMAQMDTETQDVRMPVKPVKMPDGRIVNSSEKFEIGRNFCNKIWQAATGFVLPNLEGYAPRPLSAEDLALEDHWILSRLAATIGAVDRGLERYQISEVANALYSFFWNEFCDWYVELAKPRLYRPGDGATERRSDKGPCAPVPTAAEPQDASAAVARQVLAFVLDQSLRLMHPIMPFVTEAVWKKLNEAAPRRGITRLTDGEPALIRAAWPDTLGLSRKPEIESRMEALQNVIRGLRDTLAWVNSTRSAAKKPALGKLPKAIIRTEAQLVAGLAGQVTVICRLGRCEELEIGTDAVKPPESATKVFPGIEVFVPIAGLADLAAERQRLTRERDQVAAQIECVQAKLVNVGFVSKAPAAVVEQERARLAELQRKLETIERHVGELGP